MMPSARIQHIRIGEDVGGRRKAPQHPAPIGIGQYDLDQEADRDHPDQRDDERLDPAEALGLQPQDQEHVERGDDDADLERNAEDQIEPDSGADHLGKVGRHDRQLRQGPERPRYPARKRIAAGLRQILARPDGKARTQRLEDNRHDIAEQCHRQQGIAELAAARERGRPIAGIHVADGNQIARPEEGCRPAPGRSGCRDLDRSVDVRKRWITPVTSP